MLIDISTIAPEARARYLELGRQWGPTDTLDQAHQTLKGCAKYGAEIAKDGFSTKDAQRLGDARDSLIAAGVGRAEARGDKKVTSQSYIAAITKGKTTRESARSILSSTRSALHDIGSEAAKAGVKTIDAVLHTTRTSGEDAEALATQLDLLRGALSDANVAAEAADRGGPGAITELQTAAAALRAANAERAGSPGTQAETERLDVLGGIIITLARNAFKAARAAAKRLGQPSLAADFELTKLYAARAAATDTPNNDKPAPAKTKSDDKPAPAKTQTDDKPAPAKAPSNDKPVEGEAASHDKPAPDKTPSEDKPGPAKAPSDDKPAAANG